MKKSRELFKISRQKIISFLNKIISTTHILPLQRSHCSKDFAFLSKLPKNPIFLANSKFLLPKEQNPPSFLCS
ncbi:hypothetical protein QVD17_11002 [Tagetes erecta]|uniref:Uncharacterized protein n=1 Tax=Tagetes erecta TaxID=13708 RepID=A0AAD8L283_TARER|nr:hypothetical protein QVD17_11002 [Tagetes erecta]